jgi:hypothetical protein
MPGILNLETLTVPESEPSVPAVEQTPELPEATVDYEIVLGRAQIASWLFLGVVAVAICSSLAFLAGKTFAGKTLAAKTAPAVAVPVPATKPAVASQPLPAASIVVPPKPDLTSIVTAASKPAPPLFAEPETGKVYIQIGAVERGMAMLLVEGLRSHGFDSFVAPGPNDRVFRVLIGPLPDPQSFTQARAAIDALELSNFARKYQK